jgi:hypothetical protein
MGTSPQREVVVEVERIKRIRRRMRTSLRFCSDCSRSTDFIPLAKAGGLFGATPEELFEFIRSNHCHFLVDNEGEIHICLPDLLAAMSRKLETGTFKLLGEQKNEGTLS